MRTALVVGAGVFGASAALELVRRGVDVTVVCEGGVGAPHPRAASTDISKLVRMDYGSDTFYFELMERALEGWRRWNTPYYHPTGMLVLRRTPMPPDSFEGQSLAQLERRGHRVERLVPEEVRERFGRFHPEHVFHGYLSPDAGWAESGAVTAWLQAEAARAGARFRDDAVVDILETEGGRHTRVRTRSGELLEADVLVVAAGAWTPALLPELAPHMRVVGQPVFHLAPPSPASAWEPPEMLPWTCDIATTGWYGFALGPSGEVKIANHGVGLDVTTDAPDVLPEIWDERLRAFLREHMPELESAPIVHRRLCLYCDTWDGDFYITPHPERPGLCVAAGGSGHGFKFAPLLGELIADAALDGKVLERFRYREPRDARWEDARCMEEPEQG